MHGRKTRVAAFLCWIFGNLLCELRFLERGSWNGICQAISPYTTLTTKLEQYISRNIIKYLLTSKDDINSIDHTLSCTFITPSLHISIYHSVDCAKHGP